MHPEVALTRPIKLELIFSVIFVCNIYIRQCTLLVSLASNAITDGLVTLIDGKATQVGVCRNGLIKSDILSSLPGSGEFVHSRKRTERWAGLLLGTILISDCMIHDTDTLFVHLAPTC